MKQIAWENPLWYRRYRIYYADTFAPYKWEYQHDDYDGAPDGNDNRAGHCNSIEECIDEIDELEDDE